MARDRILIQELGVECIIGVLAHEREREQLLLVDVELELDTSVAAKSGRIRATCDYDRITAEVMALLKFRRYRLLEMAAEELAAVLLGLHPLVESTKIRLTKPSALPGRARAAVEINRDPRDYPRNTEVNDFGEVEILYQTREAGLYLLHIERGREIPSHYHRVMRELEWHVAGEIERDGARLTGFAPVIWPREKVHRYVNVGEDRATLFCCDCPPFVPEDEIRVPTP